MVTTFMPCSAKLPVIALVAGALFPNNSLIAPSAYFVGIRFGKHKLAPVVSPNKTIEGALGGIVTAMAGMVIYALVLDLLPVGIQVNYALALLYGLAGSLAGIFGDLCFSVIKRQTGIKDYGDLIPGHGGILDRFDSLVTVAPLMEALLLIAPMVMM